jgi:uncharacterized protein
VRRRIDAITLPGAGREPVAVVVHATGPGPVVAVTANIHGDEVTGVAAVHRLDELFPTLLVRGTVVLYPSLNPRGLARQQRVQPDDGVDLNRVFPGERDGTGAARHAALLWKDFADRKLDALVDLHADSAVSVPYAIVDRATHLRGEVRERMDEALQAMAHASGLTVLNEYPEDQYVKFHLDRSLAGAMVNHAGIAAVTLEVGPRRAVDPAAVRVTVAAVLRILVHLGLVQSDPEDPVPRLPGGPWRRIAAPRVRFGGVFEPVLSPGDRFDEGAVLGTVRAIEGTVREVVSAAAPGIVVSWTESAWIEARGVPGTLGVVER